MKTTISTLTLFILLFGMFATLTAPVSADELVWQGLSQPFTLYANSGPTYTGPAAAKAVLKYTNEVDFTQKQLADMMETDTKGTYLANIVSVLNRNLLNSSMDVYNGRDADTVFCSLYDTVVRNNTPAIIGVKSTTKAGWPYDMDRSRYVVVYGVSSDLRFYKIADPTGLVSSTDQIEHFYVVSASALYNAYVAANTGLTYIVNQESIAKKGFDVGSISLVVTPDRISLAKPTTSKYKVVNNSDSKLVYGSDFSLQRYDSREKAWVEVGSASRSGEVLIWIAVAYELKAHSFSTYDLPLEFYTLAPGIYRLVKQVSTNNMTHEIYSNKFMIVK